MISTHALREEGDMIPVVGPRFLVPISTHALREEGDITRKKKSGTRHKFLPTPSARRATSSG